MLVLHVYEPKDRPEDQIETWEALARLTALNCYSVQHERTEGEYGYAEVLARYWSWPSSLLIWEQDIVAVYHQVVELEACLEPFCAFDYYLASGTLWSKVPNAVGWGLSRLSPEARASVKESPPVPHHRFVGMPARLKDRLPPVHVHRPPVKHNHVG